MNQLLLGAVRHGLNLEKLYPDFPALRLTSEIGRASRVVPEGDLMKLAAYFFVSDPRYWDKRRHAPLGCENSALLQAGRSNLHDLVSLSDRCRWSYFRPLTSTRWVMALQ